jgi:hypothetical protein
MQSIAFASNYGTVAFCPLEDLRKLSVKKKKTRTGDSIAGIAAMSVDDWGLQIRT